MSTPHDDFDFGEVESISTNATDDNLPGPGRTLGVLFDNLGARLETGINRQAARTGLVPSHLRNDDDYAGTSSAGHSHHSQLARISSNISVSTTATAPGLPGAGRSVGLVLDWLGARLERVMNTRAALTGRGPVSIARQIGALRQHDRATFSGSHYLTPDPISLAVAKKLKKLCKRLLKYARSPVRETQFKTCDEIISLTIRDPLVREALAQCDLRSLTPDYREPDLILSTSRALGSIELANVHRLWSRAISLRNPVGHNSDLNRLAWSLRSPESSFLSARYLLTAMGLDDNADFQMDCKRILYPYYMDTVSANPDIIEWSNINDCVWQLNPTSITSMLSLKETLRGVGKRLLPEAVQIPVVVATTLGVPKIKFGAADIGSDQDSLGSSINPVSKLQSDTPAWLVERDTAVYMQLLEDITGSNSITNQLSYLHSLNHSMQRQLRKTIFAYDVIIAYIHLLHIMGEGNTRLDWSNPDEVIPEPSQSRLSSACTVLENHYSSDNAENRDLAIFFMARFATTDRYCKLMLFHGILGQSSFPILLDTSTAKTDLDPPFGFNTELLLFPGFNFMRCFQCGGKCYITNGEDNEVPFGVLQFLKHSEMHQEFSVHSMEVGTDTVTALLYSDGSEKPFNATGHYPILAGYDHDGSELYIAVIEINAVPVLSCIRDGADTVTYTDSEGIEHTSSQFSVLTLRRNPSDIQPPYPQPIEGAINPTGPLFWRKYWPNKDQDLEIEDRNMDLVAFLDYYAGSIHETDKDSDRLTKLGNALEASGLLQTEDLREMFEMTHGSLDSEGSDYMDSQSELGSDMEV